MMMPMMGFLFALIVVGGLASLVAKADPHAKLAPFLGFPLLFARLAAFCLSLGLGGLGEHLDRTLGTDLFAGLGFLGGYTLGGLGGALLGLRKVLRRKWLLQQKSYLMQKSSESWTIATKPNTFNPTGTSPYLFLL